MPTKLSLDTGIEFGEVQFYFSIPDPENGEEFLHHALVSVYGAPDAQMFEDSFHTLRACQYRGEHHLCIINLHSILSVVSMQPLPQLPDDPENLWFVVEKSGLDDMDVDT